MNKLFIRTMGCQMNEYDSEKMFAILKNSHNLTPTDNEKEADVLLVNTCSIREKAEDKLFHQLGRWRKLKDKNPDVIIGVGGCVATQEGDLILKRAPFVDAIFGPQTIHRLPQMIDSAGSSISNKNTSIDISFPEIEKFDNLPQSKSSSVSSFVSIMEGCSKYCSFCVVPYTRGEEISRPFEQVMEEVQNLVKMGVAEIHLLGQNVNAYRGDFEDDFVDLAFLIEAIADIEKVERIRFTTSHPVEFSDRLIEVYGKTDKLVNHLHLPVQSGSDKILAQMKRGHTALEYKAKMKKLRQIRPNISLSSDFIIGFPSESDDDFNATIKLIKDIGFDKSFSYIYSQRPGTPASSMIDDVSLDIKKQRLTQLQKIIDDKTLEITNSMVGSVQKVLVERVSKKSGKLFGKTENMRNTHFDGDESLIGKVVSVKIDSGFANSLSGSLIVD
jgi:tRNA-2-methylthio-N6-dimethylallyladenosine synthase